MVELWVVEPPWDDKFWADVFGSPAPPFERLHRLVHLVHAHIEEWWDTRAYNRKSAKRGRRVT